MTVNLDLATARAAFDKGDYSGTLSQLSALIDHRRDQELLILLGETLAQLGELQDAAAIFEEAAALGGAQAGFAGRRAAEMFFATGDDSKAQLIGLRALSALPDDPALVFVLVSLFLKSGETELVDALKNRLVHSDNPEHLRLASRLMSSDLYNSNNLELFRRLKQHFPNDPFIRVAHMDYAREFWDLEAVEKTEAEIRAAISAGDMALLSAEEPHFGVMWLENEAEQRLAANLGAFIPYTEKSRRQRRLRDHRWGKKTRIGYVSADLWDDHATMRLLGEVLRQHDRAKFEITIFCNTPERFIGFDQGGRSSWGSIVSIRDLDDQAAEKLIREAGIDILVDLKGHTGQNRAGLFNRQAAPVQVAWLGFPGSSVGIDCDYIIGDRHVLPDEAAPHYHELFCRLPECYQPNDPVNRALPPAIGRSSLGLPEDVFLFASFNSGRKLSPLTFDLWGRVMREAKQAHLWIMGEKAPVEQAFARRGISADRLHFAEKTAYPHHIARVQAADLGLDTFPCNGHTTTSDMLWAGVPVVTYRGQTFAGRVSESLLDAAGIPELVARNADEFVSLAASLASDRQRSAAFSQTLRQNRFRAPLFDAERFCRHLETAFARMAGTARAGKPPRAFDVEALPPRIGEFRH